MKNYTEVADTLYSWLAGIGRGWTYEDCLAICKYRMENPEVPGFYLGEIERSTSRTEHTICALPNGYYCNRR